MALYSISQNNYKRQDRLPKCLKLYFIHSLVNIKKDNQEKVKKVLSFQNQVISHFRHLILERSNIFSTEIKTSLFLFESLLLVSFDRWFPQLPHPKTNPAMLHLHIRGN